MKKYLAIIMALIVVFELILGITNYSFSNNSLNYALITLVVLGVFYFFLTLGIPLWLKILTMIVTLGGIGYLGFWAAILVSLATEDVEVINKWNYDNYEISLTSRQGFSGPTYYRYDIHKPALFGLVYKGLDKVMVHYDSLKNCIVDFPRVHMTFDKCAVYIIKHANKTYE